jgi:hypothetical protein
MMNHRAALVAHGKVTWARFREKLRGMIAEARKVTAARAPTALLLLDAVPKLEGPPCCHCTQ